MGRPHRTIARLASRLLPLTDRGVDGLMHRLTDGVPVQAKGRSALMGGEVLLVVWADSRAHHDVMIVSGLLAGDFKFEFHPGSAAQGRTDAFRKPTGNLPRDWRLATAPRANSADSLRRLDDYDTQHNDYEGALV